MYYYVMINEYVGKKLKKTLTKANHLILIKGHMRFTLYIDLTPRAFPHRRPAKGQGSGASRWPAGVKVDLLADTSVGGPKATLLKRPVNHSHLFTMRRSLLAPGIQLAVSLQPLYPQPRPDKGLFTWQSASGRPGQRKERGSFQLPVGSKSSAHKRLWSHGSNLKLKRWNENFGFPGPRSYQASCPSLIAN